MVGYKFLTLPPSRKTLMELAPTPCKATKEDGFERHLLSIFLPQTLRIRSAAFNNPKAAGVCSSALTVRFPPVIGS